MIIYEDGEMYNVPSQWLAEHDKQIIDKCIEHLCEDLSIVIMCLKESPRDMRTYIKFKLEQLKGEQK